MRLKAERETSETRVNVDLETGGEPRVGIAWEHHGGLDEALDEGMAEHLYTTLLRYARLGGSLEAEGDLAHHVVEDAAITLGTALGRWASEHDIVRFSDRTVAMDEALVQVTIDAGGRPFHAGDLDAYSPLFHHVVRTIAFEAGFTIHTLVVRGADTHHVVEATLKALGMCLDDALTESDRVESTKGRVRREVDPDVEGGA